MFENWNVHKTSLMPTSWSDATDRANYFANIQNTLFDFIWFSNKKNSSQ